MPPRADFEFLSKQMSHQEKLESMFGEVAFLEHVGVKLSDKTQQKPLAASKGEMIRQLMTTHKITLESSKDTKNSRSQPFRNDMQVKVGLIHLQQNSSIKNIE